MLYYSSEGLGVVRYLHHFLLSVSCATPRTPHISEREFIRKELQCEVQR